MTSSNQFFFMLCGLFCSLAYSASAQVDCIDSNLVNPYYICNDPYYPYCGCDGYVYRNECAVHYQGGNMYYKTFNDGDCGDFDYEIRPTLVDQGFIRFELYLKKSSAVYINIYDVFGHKKLEENLGFVSPPALTAHDISLYGFEVGMYVFIVQIGDQIMTRKFVKANEY
jgi:hypothetical protein